MNTTLLRSVAAGMLLVFGASCTTAYDYYGNPRPVVEPGVAVLGAAAVGLTALALSNNGRRDNRYYNRGYSGYGRGYSGCGYQPRYQPRYHGHCY